jgi:hypothetical protein
MELGDSLCRYSEKDPSVENIPAGVYMYKTTRNGQPDLGPLILRGIRNSGYPISQRRHVYEAECQDGLIRTTAPDNPDYRVLPEFNGTLDLYLVKKFYRSFVATETPTAWPLKRRITVQKKALVDALYLIKRGKQPRDGLFPLMAVI